MTGEVVGKSGKIKVTHWHAGDDVRIFVNDERENSVYFITNSRGVAEWVNALRSDTGTGTFIVRAGNAVAEITKVGDEIRIVAYDVSYPQFYKTATFDLSQYAEIIELLLNENQTPS